MKIRTGLVTVAVAMIAAAAQPQSTDPALTAAIAARDKAAIARDADTVAKYTADDYASINPCGGSKLIRKETKTGSRACSQRTALVGSRSRWRSAEQAIPLLRLNRQ